MSGISLVFHVTRKITLAKIYRQISYYAAVGEVNYNTNCGFMTAQIYFRTAEDVSLDQADKPKPVSEKSHATSNLV